MGGDPALASSKTAYLLLVVAMLCWAGNWIVARAFHAAVPPFALNFLRWGLALLVFAAFSQSELRRHRAVLLRRWKILIVLGALGMALFHSLVYVALQTTTAINAALINSVMPVVVVLMSWGIFREKISRQQGLGIVVSLVGAAVIVTRGSLETLLHLRFTPGDLWVLASVPVWALYAVLLKLRPPELSQGALLTVVATVGVVLMVPLVIWEFAAGARVEVNPASLMAIGYVALFGSVVAYYAFHHAVARVGANVAGLFIHLHPVFTTVLAMIFLAERIGLPQVAGIALIVTGIYLTSSARRVIGQANGFRQDAGS